MQQMQSFHPVLPSLLTSKNKVYNECYMKSRLEGKGMHGTGNREGEKSAAEQNGEGMPASHGFFCLCHVWRAEQ